MSRVQNRGKRRRILTFWCRKQTQKGRFWWVSVLKFERIRFPRQTPLQSIFSTWRQIVLRCARNAPGAFRKRPKIKRNYCTAVFSPHFRVNCVWEARSIILPSENRRFLCCASPFQSFYLFYHILQLSTDQPIWQWALDINLPAANSSASLRRQLVATSKVSLCPISPLLRRQNYSFALESIYKRDFSAQRQARKSRRVSFESPIFS